MARHQVSAGGVVCRATDEGALEVILIATRAPGGGPVRWGLPKGLLADGEEAAAAAVREVNEEAGVRAGILGPLPVVEYWYWGHEGSERVRFHKRVHFFLMVYRGGDVAAHDWEVDEARWFPLDEALKRASFDSERKVLAGVAAAWAASGEKS